MPSMQPAAEAVPGDRYVTSDPCGPACVHRGHSHISIPPFLAVHPYSFIFRAPAKGRWLDRPLLPVCVDEFAYSPAPVTTTTAASSSTASTLLAAGTVNAGVSIAGATLDHRLTLPAYADELAEGRLWLQKREEECRAAGYMYRQRLIALYRASQETNLDPDGPLTKSDSVICDQSHHEWEATCLWLRSLPSPAAADAILATQLPRLLLLRQKDVVLHRVWRIEGRMFAGPPLDVTRCDLAQREKNQALMSKLSRGRSSTTAVLPPALLVVRKPSGLPVHPSGRYRKNACTAIVEDALGGCDTHLYDFQEEPVVVAAASDQTTTTVKGLYNQRYRTMALVHRRHGFTLLTVRVRIETDRRSDACDHHGTDAGLSEEDWELLKRIRSAGAAKHEADIVEGNEDNSNDHRDGMLELPVGSLADGGSRALTPLKAFVVHRLDAATSGVLIFGLDQPTARRTADLISQKDGGDTTLHRCSGGGGMQGRATVNDTFKTYLAKVRGQLTLERAQRNCRIVREGGGSSEDSTTTPGTAEASGLWLRVDRPIGCLSFHKSLYWCAGEQRTQAWLAKTASTAEGTVREDTTSVGDRAQQSANAATTSRDLAAICAKNERMRALSRGGAKRPRTQATLESGSVPSTSTPAEDFTATLRAATTLLRPLRYVEEENVTVVVCRLLTGRTHQLRVHLASLGHPIVGDHKYAALVDRLAADAVASVDSFRTGGCTEVDEDDVARYYTTGGNQLAGKGESVSDAESRAEGSSRDGACVCPDSIQLHAWRYRLSYLPDSSKSDSTVLTVQLEAEPYDAAMREAAAGLPR